MTSLGRVRTSPATTPTPPAWESASTACSRRGLDRGALAAARAPERRSLVTVLRALTSLFLHGSASRDTRRGGGTGRIGRAGERARPAAEHRGGPGRAV